MLFLEFWKRLNNELAYRGETEALYREARYWYDYRVVKYIDTRLINHVVNARKPL